MNAEFQIPIESLVATFLVSVRLGILLLATPIFGMARVPVSVRVYFVFALSACLAWPNGVQLMGAGNELVLMPNIVSAGALFLAVVAEVVIGSTLALGVYCAFAAFSFGGKLIDLQIGLGIGGIFDPVNRSLSPVLASALAMVAVVVFFGAEAHHAFFRGFAFSLEQMPLGQFPSIVDPAPVIKQMGLMFSLGLALIAPVFVGLFLVELGLSVVSRLLPELRNSCSRLFAFALRWLQTRSAISILF